MEELIKQISEKTGVTVDQAKGTIQDVLNFLKAKVPALTSQIDGLLEGGLPTNLEEVKNKIGGLFGK